MDYIPPQTAVYANQLIIQHKIDESHGIDHAQAVAEWAAKIVHSYPAKQTLIEGLDSQEAIIVIITAAYVHDLIDHKYVKKENLESAYIDLYNHLRTVGFTRDTSKYVILIITNISFSKRLTRKLAGEPRMIDMAKIGYKHLQLATEIVCDADMLDAYDPNRCITFKVHQMRKQPDDVEILRHVKLVLVGRILKYRGEYFNTDVARRISLPLHEKLEDYVDKKLSHIDITGLTYETNVLVNAETVAINFDELI